MNDQPAEFSGLTKALAAVQAAIQKIPTNQTANAGTYSYKYADLATITEKVFPELSKNGLAWTTMPTVVGEGHMVLRYELRHVDGEVLEGSYPLRAGSTPQQMGSEISYARRYTLSAVVGIATEEDDDGQRTKAAEPAPQTQRGRARGQRRAPDADAQRRKYHKMREQLGWDEDAGHDFINDLSQGRATRWTDLDARQRGVVLDAMGERIRELGRVPEGVNPETGEVKGAPEDRDDWTPGWPPQDSEAM